eukprot:TRINITY_DN12889_c0_g1_i1.p1 TRINITY_DN12889_c0_g1~~TRINITY_DN12889_c0_g1_i1.p1  ORF type:complete len:160 (+),score=30.18 TRINITY_DN12889_c0_g1_i1:140-619(+)
MGACNQKSSVKISKEGPYDVNASNDIPKEHVTDIEQNIIPSKDEKVQSKVIPDQKENSPSAAQKVRPSGILKTPTNSSDVHLSMVKSSPEKKSVVIGPKFDSPADFGEQRKPLSLSISASNPQTIPSKILLPSDKSNTCLLYTSPSPRDRQKSRMPSSA